MTTQTRADLASATRIVVKVGSSSISGENAGRIGPLVDAQVHEKPLSIALREIQAGLLEHEEGQ